MPNIIQGDWFAEVESGKYDLALFTANEFVRSDKRLIMNTNLAAEILKRWPNTDLNMGIAILHTLSDPRNAGYYLLSICETGSPFGKTKIGAFQEKRPLRR